MTIEWGDGRGGWRKAFRNLTCHANKKDLRHLLKKLPCSDQQIIKREMGVEILVSDSQLKCCSVVQDTLREIQRGFYQGQHSM